jgi:hypothetical protein
MEEITVPRGQPVPAGYVPSMHPHGGQKEVQSGLLYRPKDFWETPYKGEVRIAG